MVAAATFSSHISASSMSKRQFVCCRCGQEAQPEWRYILSLQVDDHTGQTWLTAFQACPSLSIDTLPPSEPNPSHK